MSIESYVEGIELLKTNRDLVDLLFYAHFNDVLAGYADIDLEASLLINRVLVDSVDLIEDNEDRKNAIGWCLSAKASINLATQDIDRAEDLYRQALSEFEKTPEYIPGVAATSANLGDILQEKRYYSEALDLYKKAADLYSRIDAPLGGAKIRESIGNVMTKLGEYENAERQYDKALGLIEEYLSFNSLTEDLRISGWKAQASIYLSMGHLSSLKHNYEDATSNTKFALRLYHSAKDSSGFLRAMLNLGDLYRSWGHIDEAVLHYRAVKNSSENVLREYPNAAGIRVLLLYANTGLAHAFALQGKVESAEDCYKKAISLAERHESRRPKATVSFNYGSFLAEIGSYDEAEKRVLSALSTFREIDDWRGMFECFGQLVSIETRKYEYSKALRYAEEMRQLLAQRESVDPTVKARFNIDIADLYLSLGNYKGAEKHYVLALREIRDTQSFEAIDAYINLANLHVSFGSFEKATKECQSASELASQFDYQSGIAAVKDCRGRIFLAEGDYLEALDCFQEELEIAQNLDNPTIISKAFRSLGEASYQMGRMADALRNYRSALEVLKESKYSVRDRAAIYQGIGSVYSSIGDSGKALENYNNALEIFERLNDLQGLGLCYARIGEVRVQEGKYDSAESYLSSALKFLRESGNTTNVAFIYINLGYLYKQIGKHKQAIESLKEGLRLSDQTGSELIKVLSSLHLGDIYHDSGEITAALSRYEDAQDAVSKLGLPLLAARVYSRIGDVYRDKGDTEDARTAYEEAIVFLEDSRERMQIRELKSLWPKLGLDTYHKFVNLLVRQNNIANGLFYAERCKAKNLVDLMSRGASDAEESGSLPIIKEEKELYWEISRLEEQLYEEWKRPENSRRERRIEEIKEVMSSKKEQYADLLMDMKLTAPQYLSVKSVRPQQLRYANEYVRSELSEDEVIVEYLVTGEETIAWIVEREGVKAAVKIPVSREDLVDLISGYREMITEAPPPESMMLEYLNVLKEARRLYEILIDPIRNYIVTAKHIVIVPSDVLFYLPFETLYRCHGCDGEDLLGGSFLLEDYSISYAPSISSLFWPCKNEVISDYNSILAVGNPTGDLAAAEKEVKKIASLFSETDLFVKEEGREKLVKDLLSSRNYDVVHFSTHGIFDHKIPLLSHLLFKGGQHEDGFFYAREILATELSSQLVVLSACQTALPSKLSHQTAELVMGDELQGLSQTLFVAGVPSMVLSLWNVDDRSTRSLMEEMYTSLVKGGSKAESLREAKLELIDGGRYYHPYYWSPFIIYGSWR